MITKRNDTFVILSAIGIILIMLGHLDFPVLTMGGLFPYYSFHVMLFPFISGYFYKKECAEIQHIHNHKIILWEVRKNKQQRNEECFLQVRKSAIWNA